MSDMIAHKSYIAPVFDSATFKSRQIKLSAIATYAKSMQEWKLLEEAIDAKIEEQREFCARWKKEITPNHGSGRGNKKVTDLKPFSDFDIKKWKVRVFRWRNYLKNSQSYRARLLGAEYKAALLQPIDNHRARGTGENEWYTPARYIKAVKAVLGEIDLDPASSEIGQRIIKAKRFLSIADDSLTQEWHGKVFLNPPYSQPAIWNFTQKLISELSKNNIKEAILLTHSYTDTAWFHNSESIAAAICFTRGRIAFVDADGNECAPTQGQVFFYYGNKVDRFKGVFKAFGFIR